VLLLYACAHKISMKYLFLEKIAIEICCQKCQECNTFCETNFSSIEFQRFVKKKIKYIHRNLRYYETIV
jgi:epoxyqueuosine reductase QueG